MPKRLFSVTVHAKAKYDEVGTYKVEARDDVVARAKAIPQFVKEYNTGRDKVQKADKAANDLDPDKRVYAHITEKEIAFCEIELLYEWG